MYSGSTIRTLKLEVLLLFIIFPLPFPSYAENEIVRFGVTTTVENSGLIEKLAARFEKSGNIEIQTIVSGTMNILMLLKNGDIDGALVHNPDAEKKLLAEGFGNNHNFIMYNDYILVGPGDDPAGIKFTTDIVDGLKKIKKTKSKYISRDDLSGTNMREKKCGLWLILHQKESGIWLLVKAWERHYR